jgi:hypothetical protein
LKRIVNRVGGGLALEQASQPGTKATRVEQLGVHMDAETCAIGLTSHQSLRQPIACALAIDNDEITGERVYFPAGGVGPFAETLGQLYSQ